MPINIEKFKKQHEEMKQRREGRGNDEKFWTWPLEKGKKATFLIRLLPTKTGFVTNEELGWEIKATHTIGTTDNGWPNRVLCLNYHGSESRCPACSVAGKIYRNDSVEYKDLGKSLFSDRKYWYNIVVKNNDNEWIDKEGNVVDEPMVYKYCVPRTVQEGKGGDDDECLQGLFLKYGDVSDIKKGRWIEMKIEMGDKGPNYKNIEVKDPSMLDNDIDLIKKIISNMNVLIVTQKITLYSEMIKMLETHFDEIGHPELKKMFKEEKGTTSELESKEVPAKKKENIDDDLMNELGLGGDSKPASTPAPVKEAEEKPRKRKQKEEEAPVPKVEKEVKPSKTVTDEESLDAELEAILNS